MEGHGPSTRFPAEPATLGRFVAAERWLAAGAWLFGITAFIAEWATGAAGWHFVALALYVAILPVGVGLSTALRIRQRDLDRLWGQRFHDLAIRDELTGLFNRRHFNVELDRLMSECLSAGTPLSVAFIDLNDFKAINDTHGHDAGDAALCSVAHCLLDLVGDRGIVARTGGDEFGVVLPGMSEADTQAFFGAACRTLPIPMPGSETLSVGGTVGIASLDGTHDASQLLRRADDRLYEKKRARHRERRAA
jgi:diguanylate cyclase (GGDEF)-like protein